MKSQMTNRRGVVAVLTVVMLVVLMGFAALTIDGGMARLVRAELQRAADSAALAAVQDLRDNSAEEGATLGRASAEEYLKRNEILGGRVAEMDPYADMVFGNVDETEPGEAVNFVANAEPYNAVQVTVRIELNYAFAAVFGMKSRVLTARAMAAVPPPRTVEVIPASLPVPGFGPVDPDVAAHNPGKTGPSEPADGVQFQPGEEVAVFIFGKGPMPPTHLVLDIPGAEGASDMNSWLATAESLGGEREPYSISVGDELPVWNDGTGNGNFGEKLETRLDDSDADNDTVIMPIIETLPDSRNADGRLENNVRIVDFVAVTLTEIRAVKVPDPDHKGKTMNIDVLFGRVVTRLIGTGNGFGTTSGTFTLGSVKSAPQLVM